MSSPTPCNLWLNLPTEIRRKILKHSDPFTRLLNGFVTAKDLLDGHLLLKSSRATDAWKVAFEIDYPGDLSILPKVELHDLSCFFHLVRSRSMYQRLCALWPESIKIKDWLLLKYNRYECQEYYDHIDFHPVQFRMRKALIHIPMRQCWFDLLEDIIDRFPIGCAALASKFGHIKFLTHLIQERKVKPTKFSVLHWIEKLPFTFVCQFGDVDDIKFMLEQKCVVTNEDVMAAIRAGKLDNVKFLWDIARDMFTESVMNEAALSKSIDLVKWLHHTARFTFSSKAISNAASVEDAEMVKLIFSVTPDIIVTSDHVERVGRFGKPELVRLLALNEDGINYTVCNAASECGDLDWVKALYKEYPQYFSDKALLAAASKGHLAVFTFLYQELEAIVTDDVVIKIFREACKQWCVTSHVNIIEFMLERHVNPPDFLMENAAESGQLDLIRLLHSKYNATCTYKDLEYAAFTSRMDVVECIFLNFPNVECTLRALEKAAFKNDFDMFKMLHQRFTLDREEFYPSKPLTTKPLQWKNLEMVQFILENDLDDGKKCLGGAFLTGDLVFAKAVYQLLEQKEARDAKARGDSVDGPYHLSSFMEAEEWSCAAAGGSLDVVQFVEREWDGDSSALESEAAATLAQAAVSGHVDIVRYLMDNYESFIDIDVVLENAFEGEDPSVIEYVVDFVRSNYGPFYSPLRQALVECDKPWLDEFVEDIVDEKYRKENDDGEFEDDEDDDDEL
jgi:hypothetical protein